MRTNTKPQDFYKIREDIRRKRKKKKILTSPEMFCIRTVNLLAKGWNMKLLILLSLAFIIFLSASTPTYSTSINMNYTDKEIDTLTNYQPYKINTSFQGAGNNNLRVKKARKYRDF